MALLGTGYLVTPDIIVARIPPLTDEELNEDKLIVSETDSVALATPLRGQELRQPARYLACQHLLQMDNAERQSPKYTDRSVELD